MLGDRQQQLLGRGRRSARRPRTDYTALLVALHAEHNSLPSTPVGGGGLRKCSNPAAMIEPPAAACDPCAPAEHQLCQQTVSAAAGEQHPAEGDQVAAWSPARTGKRRRGAAAAAVAALAQVGEIEEAGEEEEEEDAKFRASAGNSDRTAVAGTLAQRQRKKRQRVLVGVHGGAGPSAAAAAAAGAHRQLDPADVENAYERQRLERIQRNEQMLRQLGVAEAAGGLAAAVAAEQRQQLAPGGVSAAASRGPPRRRERQPALPAAALPVRKSKRQRGERPLAPEEAVAEAAAELGAGAVPDLSGATEKELEQGALLDLEHYFELLGQDISGAVHSDGRFCGWVSPAVCERYGVPPDPDAAWEAGGGGKFSFKIDKKAIPANLKGRGWSDARAFSHTQLLKNPNAYFYRHVAPHEQQAQGEWTEEEHRVFVETARAHGVGDKWGLFASYLPQRVGYQCSAYYRDVIIPQGLVIDKRFKMTRNGKAVFVG